MLKDAAIENGVNVRTGTSAVSVEPREHGQQVVTLKSGETIRADVVIGADGVRSIVREVVVGEPEPTTYLDIDICNVFIPGDRVAADPELKELLEEVRFEPLIICYDELTGV